MRKCNNDKRITQKSLKLKIGYPAGIYLLKVNSRNTRTRCEICSKLTIKIANFQHISHPALVFLLLTLNM